MSAIAYNADPNMIDYHRLKGNQTMAFWRLSLRDFSRFSKGDLFFFIDRRARHPHTQEKGLVGYGRCVEIKNQSLTQTWKQYETATGYNRYEDFRESVRYYRKNDHRLPSQIQTILLENVVFLQQPIFLSEIGIELTGHLESFIYIEKEGKDASKELISIAKKIGIDSWMVSQNPSVGQMDMDEDIHHQKIRNQLMKVDVGFDLEQERLLKNHTEGVAHHQIYYIYKNQSLTIFLPLTRKTQFNALIGIKAILEATLDFKPVHFTLVSNIKLDAHLEHLIAVMNVKHVQI